MKFYRRHVKEIALALSLTISVASGHHASFRGATTPHAIHRTTQVVVCHDISEHSKVVFGPFSASDAILLNSHHSTTIPHTTWKTTSNAPAAGRMQPMPLRCIRFHRMPTDRLGNTRETVRCLPEALNPGFPLLPVAIPLPSHLLPNSQCTAMQAATPMARHQRDRVWLPRANSRPGSCGPWSDSIHWPGAPNRARD
jgi:hypothetical protein